MTALTNEKLEALEEVAREAVELRATFEARGCSFETPKPGSYDAEVTSETVLSLISDLREAREMVERVSAHLSRYDPTTDLREAREMVETAFREGFAAGLRGNPILSGDDDDDGGQADDALRAYLSRSQP